MKASEKNKRRVEKLIRFFKSLSEPRIEKVEPEFPDRDKTEAEYRKEQAEWLEQVERKQKTAKKKD